MFIFDIAATPAGVEHDSMCRQTGGRLRRPTGYLLRRLRRPVAPFEIGLLRNRPMPKASKLVAGIRTRAARPYAPRELTTWGESRTLCSMPAARERPEEAAPSALPGISLFVTAKLL